jgi:hypothetical protein
MSSERLGAYQASIVAGVSVNKIYVAAAKRVLPSVVEDGKLYVAAADVRLWRDKLDALEDARLQASIEARDRKFRQVNRGRAGNG